MPKFSDLGEREVECLRLSGTLKPCPWCGQLPNVLPWHGGAPTKHMVECEYEDCAAGPSVTGETLALAIAAWNRRAEPPSPSGTPVVCRESGTPSCAPGGGGVNEYRPWEAEGTTELKYWKRAYLTARREASEPTTEALEAWADELMDLVEELYSVEDWRNPEKGITQREACIDALRCEIARRLREATS